MTSRVTSHIPLKDVSGRLTKESILRAMRLLDATLKMYGVEKPRLGVAGLNPHNGENGTCGREEIDVIAPAIVAARAEITATESVTHNEFKIILSLKRSAYQCSVKPFQLAIDFPSLKEKTTSISIGRYMNNSISAK